MTTPSPAARAQIVALVAEPYDATITVDLLDWPLPTGDVGLPIENQFSLSGGTAKVYAATEGFTSGAAHTPPDTWFAPLMAEPFNFGIVLFNGVEPSGEQGRAGAGRLVLTDPDGLIDSWLAYGWDGRTLSLRRGVRGTDPGAWTQVAMLTADGITHDLAGKYFSLRDLQYRLYSSTFLQYHYAGTGGIEGDANLAGQAKPIALGRTFNAEPVALTPGILLYQCHFRAIEAITAVRDGGSPITFDADYGSYTALAAATVPAGKYATCLAQGLLRLGSTPTFGIRVDGKGDKLDGIYVETRGGIARRIATSIGDQILGDPSNIDTASFADMDSAQPAPCGLYLINPEATVGSVLDQFMAGCAGWWTMSLTGQMRVDFLREPDVTADFTFAKVPDLADVPRMELAPPPRSETSIGWQRNWGPQDPATTLAGVVTEADRRLYSQVWSFSDPLAGRDDSILAEHPAARRVFVEGFYALQADADTEAARQRGVFSAPQRRWRVRVHCDPFTDILGKTVEITGMNRLGWGASMLSRCIGVEASVSAEETFLILIEGTGVAGELPPDEDEGDHLTLGGDVLTLDGDQLTLGA